MYMSYCRHEGTLYELKVCLGDVENHLNDEAEYPVSDHEIACFENMVRTFHDFLVDNELLDDFGGLNEEELENICDAMKRGGYNEED